MAEDYTKFPDLFRVFSLQEYLGLITDLVAILNPDFVIDRIAGEVPPELTMIPSWKLRYDQILLEFEKTLIERDLWQGKYYNPKDEITSQPVNPNKDEVQ
jgi:radical SAM superfamily enzyme